MVWQDLLLGHVCTCMYMCRHTSELHETQNGWPVNDAFGVKELKGQSDLGGVKLRSWLFKTPGLLDVEHEVTTVHKLHDKE